ncbi:hypothetical protein [Nisaea sediminum]|uniref:hypothetical protein n=1 Tax=Nisaea sediminum TaxID=2775867 RepID=UPI001865BEF5|nr:hypothetical protein [Nisaea sediminum]
MNFETTFLTNYGLQNYVSFSRAGDEKVFSIDGEETPKMIDHARFIISEMYGDATKVVVN